VDRCIRTRRWITEKYRNAIGSLYTNEHTMEIGNKRVEFLIRSFDIRFIRDELDVIAVNLPDGRESKIVFEHGEKSTTIFCDVLRGVFVKSGKIQIVGRKRRNAAEARRKSIREPGSLERIANQNTYTIAFSPMEACIG
jgi:hypothetical protein